MLFRNETAVWVVVGAIMAFASLSVAADPPPAAYGAVNPQDSLKAYKECQADPTITNKNICNQLLGGNSKNDTDKCDEAFNKFSEAEGKLGTACGKFGMGDSAKDCAEKIRKCSSKDKAEDGVICPIADATELDKKKDDAQKVEDEISKLKEKLGTFDDKVAELNEQANKQAQEIQKHISKMQSDFTTEEAKRRTAYTDGMNQFQKQAVAQIQQMQQEYDKLTLQMKQIPTQIAQAQIQNYDQVVTKLRLDCHNQALQIVQKRQADDMAKIAKSQYTVGGLMNIVKRLGMTDEQRYELQAMYYEKKCLNDSAYVQQVNLADKTARIARQSIMAQKDGMVQQQSRMIQTMGTLMSQNQLDKSQAYQKMQTEEAAARQSYTTEMGSLNSQLSTVQNSTMGKIQSLNTQKQQLSSQIDQKNSYLEGKKQIVKLAEDLTGGKNRSSKDADEVNSAHGSADGAAKSAKSACKCGGRSPLNSDNCEEVNDYLKASTDADYSRIAGSDDLSPATPARGLANTSSGRSVFTDTSTPPATSVTPSDTSGNSWLNNGTTTFGTGASPGTSN